jgi:AcrR family transcriptional regulator
MSEAAPRYGSIPLSARPSARERLLAAAGELFYEEGINSVGIDRVIERAGVAKASLYNIFGSKDELIRAYLEARHAARRARLEKALAGLTDPRERLLAVFDVQARVAEEPGFRGCPFVRADSELAAGSPAKQVSDKSRAWLRGVFTDLARENGVADPEALAWQLVLLYDGAAVSTQMDGDAGAARRARALAEQILDASRT